MGKLQTFGECSFLMAWSASLIEYNMFDKMYMYVINLSLLFTINNTPLSKAAWLFVSWQSWTRAFVTKRFKIMIIMKVLYHSLRSWSWWWKCLGHGQVPSWYSTFWITSNNPKRGETKEAAFQKLVASRNQFPRWQIKPCTKA